MGVPSLISPIPAGTDQPVLGGPRDGQRAVLVLLLPGMSGNTRQWDRVVTRLRDVPADLAHGPAILPHPAFAGRVPTVEQLADAVAAELAGSAAHYERVVLVSHSVGAFVALGVARRLPSTVSGVVAVNGGLTGVARFLDRPFSMLIRRPATALLFLWLLALVSAPAPDVVRRAIASRPFLCRVLLGRLASAPAFATRRRREALLAEGGHPDALPAVWRNRHHWRTFVGYAREVSVDVLFVNGAWDPVAPPRDADHMRALLPNARVRTLAGVGHAAPLEVPDVVAAVLRDTVAGALSVGR